MNDTDRSGTGSGRPHLLIVIASTRPGRVGFPVGQWIQDQAEKHGGFDVSVADLAAIALPFLDEPNHPRLRQYTHDHTKAWSAVVDAANAFIFVAPEYNHGFNAPLKNALDYLYGEWHYKPVGLVSYGGVSGGLRGAQMLKPVLSGLKMVPLPEAVPIPFVHRLLNEEGRLMATEEMDEAAETMLNEAMRWVLALRPLRPEVVPR